MLFIPSLCNSLVLWKHRVHFRWHTQSQASALTAPTTQARPTHHSCLCSSHSHHRALAHLLHISVLEVALPELGQHPPDHPKHTGPHYILRNACGASVTPLSHKTPNILF